MTAVELIEELTYLVEKHGNVDVFILNYEISNVDYDVADDCIDIN